MDYLHFLDQAEEDSGLLPFDGAVATMGRSPTGGHFEMRPDKHQELWPLDWPVICVDWYSAARYTAWMAQQTGQPWSLPTEDQWEKAARGVDGRLYPWGDHIDPTLACTRESFPNAAAMKPRTVDTFPLDRSPYGLRGMGGNVRDWCADNQSGEGKAARGGAWTWEGALCQIPRRVTHDPRLRVVNLGFRIARSFP